MSHKPTSRAQEIKIRQMACDLTEANAIVEAVRNLHRPNAAGCACACCWDEPWPCRTATVMIEAMPPARRSEENPMTAQPKTWTSAHDNNVLSSADQRGQSQLDAVREQLDKASTVYPRAMRILRDGQAGAPKGQAFGDKTSNGTTLWCWDHERDLPACLTLGLDCDGHPVPVNDPTGEAAIRADRDAMTAQRIRDRLARIAYETARLTDDLLDAVPAKRTPTDKDRRETAMDNTKGCQSCSRIDGHNRGVPFWSQVDRPATTANGNLPTPMDCCSWCYRWVLDTSRLPSPSELTAHRDGIKVMRPA